MTENLADLNRAQRRALGALPPLPARSLMLTRLNNRVLVLIDQVGGRYVSLTDVQAIEFAEAMLREAGRTESQTPDTQKESLPGVPDTPA